MSSSLGLKYLKKEILYKMLFKEKCPLFTFRTIKLSSHIDAVREKQEKKKANT